MEGTAMKTWAGAWQMDGEQCSEGYLTEPEARTLADSLREIDPAASAADMLPQLAARFPVGARVRNTGTTTLGTVTGQKYGPDARPYDACPAHAIMWRGEEAVSVAWDGSRGVSWTVATWVELAN